MSFDIGAHFGHDFVDAAVALGLELDQYVAAVGFCHRCEPELQTSAPRSALYFRHFAQHLFNVGDDPVGFRQRAAGGHDVVDSESTFIHLR